MNSFWKDYPVIKDELYSVKTILKQNVRCSQSTIEKALLELIDSGGKMLRPAFVLLAGRFGNYDSIKLTNLGAVVEMLHMATLIHDDIVDDASIRRGSKTIQSKYGKDYAVFMGDFLFSKCFMLLSKDTSMENIREVSKVVSRICVGEIDQFSSRFIPNTSIKKYLRRIAAKTAALFALSFYIGASESGCDKKMSNNMGKLGYNIGMAFQIIDDILDYNGEQETVGKPLGNDLKQGVFTLPLIYALRNENNALISLLNKDFYTDGDIRNIIDKTKKLKGVEKARNLASRYTDKAFKQIKELPDIESKKILYDITERLLSREY